MGKMDPGGGSGDWSQAEDRELSWSAWRGFSYDSVFVKNDG